jgi:hypothetical protein
VLAEQLKALVPNTTIVPDVRTNNVLIRGTSEDVEMAESIALKLDQAESRQTATYQSTPAANTTTTPRRAPGAFGTFGAGGGGSQGGGTSPPSGNLFGATGESGFAFVQPLEAAEARLKAAEAASKAADLRYKELEAALQKVQSAAKAGKADDIAAQLEEIRAMTENQRRDAEKQRRLAEEQRRAAEKMARDAASRWEVQRNWAPTDTDKRVQELVAKMHQLAPPGQQVAGDAQKRFEDFKQQLRKMLDSQFQERQKTESDELKQLRLRLEKLEKEVSDRAANRQSLIDRRLQDLLSDQSRSGTGVLMLNKIDGDSVLTISPSTSDLQPTMVTGTLQLNEPGATLTLSPNLPTGQLKLAPAGTPPSDSAPSESPR